MLTYRDQLLALRAIIDAENRRRETQCPYSQQDAYAGVPYCGDDDKRFTPDPAPKTFWRRLWETLMTAEPR